MSTLHAIVVCLLCLYVTRGQILNRAPQFLPGGDMARFALYEDTPAGSPIYKLLGSDPEQSRVHFSISGDYFTVDKFSGVVKLLREVDREKIDLIEVIISITDEGVDDAEPNTVSLRRVIPIIDVNDNPPIFQHRPYSFRVAENTRVGATLYSNITVTDADLGNNADVVVECADVVETCELFDVTTEKLGEGQYVGIVSLLQPLDYETTTGYSLRLRAVDQAGDVAKRLTATVNVVVDVTDVQDQPPVFLNAPYSATLPEQTKPDTSILEVRSRDGDLGNPRSVMLTLEGDDLGYFRLVSREGQGHGLVTSADLVTSSEPMDREHPKILESGGIYTFKVKATELVGEVPGDVTYSTVTIVITDVDDQLPTFNEESFEIDVSEDMGLDTPLPGLQMVVTDADVGDNSRFQLSLHAVHNAAGKFIVHPASAAGRTPVVVRVARPLDYDVADAEMRHSVFDVVASVSDEAGLYHPVSRSRVTVHLLDANDNAPRFTASSLRVHVAEDVAPGTLVADLVATDADAGDFADLRYTVRGFGADKFHADPVRGGVYVSKAAQGPPLDYEAQQSYSLTYEARDGGGRVASVNLLIDVDDVNDNAPQFEHKEYARTIREGATSFQPQLVVRATDLDSGDGGRLFYSLESTNADEALFVEPISGEVKLNRAASAADTPRGQYELVVAVSDAGTPALRNSTRVIIRVGVTGNQRPIFRQFNDRRRVGYVATLPEDAVVGHQVVKVEATDPDGQDLLISYHLAAGDKDNFIIDNRTGVITVSRDARLDLETGVRRYDVIVHAVDAGTPYRETAMATVAIEVIDVNNKPPKFDANETYVRYVSERVDVGSSLLYVKAVDPDSTSKIEYSIVDPIRAFDKTGVALKTSTLSSAFTINSTTGELRVADVLNHNKYAVVILTVQARDVNASAEQTARTEVTLYVQAFDEKNPVFLGHDWSPVERVIRISVAEELPVQTTLLTLEAKDPALGEAVTRFEIVRSAELDEFDGFISLEAGGRIVLNRRLDFEALDKKTIKLNVRAVSSDERRSSESAVVITVLDVNDNTPRFQLKEYRGKLLESARYPEVLLTVNANDSDAADASGYGSVRYALSGGHANLFVVNKETGMIQVAPNVTLDREKQSSLRFNVIATDMPQGGAGQRKSSVPVSVDVLDVNDNPPAFSKHSYTAVVPETAAPGSEVAVVAASDPDLGLGGEVVFEIFDQGEAKGLFAINSSNGHVSTVRVLTGKGRTQPYLVVVRAQDRGQPSRSTDAELRIYIGDVFSNDGVPMFVRPALHETGHVMEDAVLGTPVYQVIATDPDEPGTNNGRISYRFLEDADSRAFHIDRHTGLITTNKLLDREVKEQYRLLLLIQDQGEVPQQATRELVVVIEDVDDHKPVFKRALDDEPVALRVLEEVAVGTEVGVVTAVDADKGANAMIDYVITAGNDEQLFAVERTSDNRGRVVVKRRVDREVAGEHLLTVKCFKHGSNPPTMRKPYNRQDPSERQIKITVVDQDDNAPMFSRDNFTIGVRLNVPVDTQLLSLEAHDADADAAPIDYTLLETTFTPLAGEAARRSNQSAAFRLDAHTGDLRTADAMHGFVDGYFELSVVANNTRATSTTVKVFVLRERDLLKFVFSRPPADVTKQLEAFRGDVEHALSLPGALHIYDAQVQAKQDGSLDFSSTSSCFQLIGKESYGLNEMEALLRDPGNAGLVAVYAKYDVHAIQRCSPSISKAEASWVQVWVLGVAVFIGVAALLAVFTTCCLYTRYKRQTRHAERVRDGPRILGYLPQSGGGPPTVIMSPPPSESAQMYDWAVENLSNYHTHSTR